MTLRNLTFVGREQMGGLLLTGSLLPLGFACGGRTSDISSSAVAGAPNAEVALGSGGGDVGSGGAAGTNRVYDTEIGTGADGGATFGNGTGGATFGNGTGGTTFGSGTGGTTFGSGSGGTAFGSGSGGTTTTRSNSTGCGAVSAAGYSSCGWDPPGNIAKGCGNPAPPSDLHGIGALVLRTCDPLEYLLQVKPTQDCYRNGVTLDVPVLISGTSGVTIGTGYTIDTPGVFEYPLHSTTPIEQLQAVNFQVKLSITCSAGEPPVSAEGGCGFYRSY